MKRAIRTTRRTRIASAIAALCAAAASSIAISAALPLTTAGSLDPSFGSGGKIFHNPIVDVPDEGMATGAVMPDGRFVMSGSIDRAGGGNSVHVARILDDGSPDLTFAGTGSVTLAIDQDSYADSYGPAIDANGRIFVAGGTKPDATYRCTVIAFRSDGSLDPQFGDGGIARIQMFPGVGADCVNVKVQADGKVVALGRLGSPTDTTFVVRLNANGTPDLAFGNNGFATLPLAGTQGMYGLAIAANGMIYVSGGSQMGDKRGYLYRVTPNGQVDSQFGNGGAVEVPIANSFLNAVRPLPDGSVLASGHRDYSKQLVLKFTARGQPATDFGTNGIAEFALGMGYSAITLDTLPNGKIIAGIRLRIPGGTWRFAVLRLKPDGKPDPTFGIDGVSMPGLGVNSETLRGAAIGPDGKIWVTGIADLSAKDSAFAVARLVTDEITTPVIEFHNTVLDHYFITADPNEASAIDGGAAGPGWTRTGQSWKSGGPSRVCRFYGSPEIDPATSKRRGPNGHFYTISADECAQVKEDAGWKFESYDFSGWKSQAGGQCAAGTIAVKRVYNNRFAMNDSNHRYATSDSIYDQMVAQSWSGEGTVYCAPI